MNPKKQFLPRESLVSQLLLYPETNDNTRGGTAAYLLLQNVQSYRYWNV
jgi:hypothetical protein